MSIRAEDSDNTGVDKIIEARHQGSDDALKAFKDAKETEKVAKLKKFGDKAVEIRTASITELNKHLTEGRCRSLTAAQRTEISAALDAISLNLTAKQKEIESDTDLETAKADVKQVYSEHHVFAGIVPAVNGACIASRLVAVIDGKITDAVTKLKTAGIDTTAIEAKLATAKTKAEDAYTIYLSILKAPNATDLKAKFETAKADLQSVRQTLGDVKSDIGNLLGEYKTKTSSEDSAPSTP